MKLNYVCSALTVGLIALAVASCGGKSDSSTDRTDNDTITQTKDQEDVPAEMTEAEADPEEQEIWEVRERLALEAELASAQAELEELQERQSRRHEEVSGPPYIEDPKMTAEHNAVWDGGTLGTEFKISFKADNLTGKIITATMHLRHTNSYRTDCSMVNDTYKVSWKCSANPQRLVGGIIRIPYSNFTTKYGKASIEADVTFTDDDGNVIPSEEKLEDTFWVINTVS